MRCQLCHQESALRNSHIIPEFQYKPLYDNKHRFYVISTDPNQKQKFEQKGFREELLCDTCEGVFSRWEGYAKKVIFDDTVYLVERTDHYMRLGGIDYLPFKLYLMSLIWRMGISTLEIFSAVKLGPHQERLRLMLLAGDPGPPDLYPTVLTGLLLEGEYQPDWILPPDKLKMDGHHTYRTVISGILFTFFITSRPFEFDMSQAAINTEGNFLMDAEDVRNIPFLCERVTRYSIALQKNTNET